MSFTVISPTLSEKIELVNKRNVGYTGIWVYGAGSNGESKHHDIWDNAPCEWSEARGATHTLDCGIGLGKGTRPAKLLKTVLYVGIDEVDDKIVWEKWKIRQDHRSPDTTPMTDWSGFYNNYHTQK